MHLKKKKEKGVWQFYIILKEKKSHRSGKIDADILHAVLNNSWK